VYLFLKKQKYRAYGALTVAGNCMLVLVLGFGLCIGGIALSGLNLY
jgi:hypothetical protein